MKTIAFFGHRQIYDLHAVQEKVIKTLKDIIPQGGANLLIGCHGDFDNIVLSACLDYKKNINHDIKIIIVLTSFSFLKKDEYGFSRADFYKEKGCETIFYDIENVHYKNRISVSNKRMTEDSDLIVCFVDTKSYKSGAKRAVGYAIKQNKKIINLFY